MLSEPVALLGFTCWNARRTSSSFVLSLWKSSSSAGALFKTSWMPMFLLKIMTVKMIEDFIFFKNLKFATLKHNQNLWLIQWWLVHAVWECSQKLYNRLLSHSQQFSPSPQIHPHSIKTSNYVLGYHSVQRQKGRKLQNTGYQKCTPHQQRGDMYQYFHQMSCHSNSVFCGFMTGTVIPRIHMTQITWGQPSTTTNPSWLKRIQNPRN